MPLPLDSVNSLTGAPPGKLPKGAWLICVLT